MNKISLTISFFVIIPFILSAQPTSQDYWTGSGGQGMAITVSEFQGVNLNKEEEHLLPLIQGNIIGVMQKYSAMTVFDQHYIENIINEQIRSISGNYSDIDPVRVGRLTNARLVVFGSISKVNNDFMLDIAVTDIQTGERVASYIPRQVSYPSLMNFTAVKIATADILQQLGIQLTAKAQDELDNPERDSAIISGAEALARGNVAERQGNTVEAARYYFQASTYDPSLKDIMNRVSVLSASVSGGNYGSYVMNRMQEHDAWRNLVTEMKKHYLKCYPFEFRYDPKVGFDDIKINFDNRTASFKIPVRLSPSEEWKQINDFRKGLKGAKRKDKWDFDLNDIGPKEINIVLQVVNQEGSVLATTTHTFGRISETKPIDGNVSFIVNAEKMDDLVIRVSNINGIETESAMEMGMIKIISNFNRRNI